MAATGHPVHILERQILKPKHLSRVVVSNKDALHAADPGLHRVLEVGGAHEVVVLALERLKLALLRLELVEASFLVVESVHADRDRGAGLDVEGFFRLVGEAAVDLRAHEQSAVLRIRVGLRRLLLLALPCFEVPMHGLRLELLKLLCGARKELLADMT